MKANSEKLNMGKRFIPRYALNRLGSIFLEGWVKYGLDNWKKGVFDDEYQHERLEHALDHLWKWLEGDRSEDHLAKVMWFCSTQMELERLEEQSLNQYVTTKTTISDSLTPTNPLNSPSGDSILKGEDRLERSEDELYKQENPKENPIEKLLKNLKKTFSGNAGD